EERGRLNVAGGDRPRARGRANCRDDEARVVDLRVVIEGRALETLVADAGLDAANFLRTEQAMALHVPERGEQIVQPHPGPQLPGRDPSAAVDRKNEGEWAHEMRRDLEQHAAL